MFIGFAEKDDAPLYDTKVSAIERARMMVLWGDDPDMKIMVHREWMPLWLAHLFKGTPLQWLAYYELSIVRTKINTPEALRDWSKRQGAIKLVDD